ncbi:MAG: hypothetical protein NC094_07560 [Bacteroidales bacterium]|nr:hypothetical protein [Lachnoclostridium sp.]MCM1384730.1 hypothetical protein [Lachnoclostridium sp.]MCM1465256.1 hypothetical protein [Bacteroidales bacterium]
MPKEISLQSLTGYQHEIGRTDYIPEGIKVDNWLQFAYWTIYRMFSFWCSPLPAFWSSVLDVFCFAVDVMPWLILNMWMLHEKHGRKCHQATAGILVTLLYTFVYGWATNNAGTAMRHRGQLIGVVVMTILIGMQEVKHRQKES